MTPEHGHLPEDPEETPPLLAQVIERKIRTITRLRLQTARERTVQTRLADAITAFAGSMLFVYLSGARGWCWTGGVGWRRVDPCTDGGGRAPLGHVSGRTRRRVRLMLCVR